MSHQRVVEEYKLLFLGGLRIMIGLDILVTAQLLFGCQCLVDTASSGIGRVGEGGVERVE